MATSKITLDWSKLLGFDQATRRDDDAQGHRGAELIQAKVGGKAGFKLGSKIGGKKGMKLGSRLGSKAGIKN